MSSNFFEGIFNILPVWMIRLNIQDLTGIRIGPYLRNSCTVSTPGTLLSSSRGFARDSFMLSSLFRIACRRRELPECRLLVILSCVVVYTRFIPVYCKTLYSWYCLPSTSWEWGSLLSLWTCKSNMRMIRKSRKNVLVHLTRLPRPPSWISQKRIPTSWSPIFAIYRSLHLSWEFDQSLEQIPPIGNHLGTYLFLEIIETTGSWNYTTPCGIINLHAIWSPINRFSESKLLE